ncbi:aminoacyl-tRNA hydrolase [Candidatus Parcubacteria bacterium]|nr:aminoacyl-tRNA hydrolase [Candidatus Parcubacteria bacterium]
MKLIVGLGNPGKRYARTRHNVGFMLLDELHKELKRYNINEWELSKKFNAKISGCTISGEKIILAKPMTYMNHSGQTVQLIMHFYKMTHNDLIVVHDDKDILLGEIKMQTDKNHAGHNGIKSIIEHIGTKDFMRLRVGVASENKRKMKDTAKFVLHKFGMFEKKKLEETIQESITEIKKLV